jgi:hypothetical protein
VHLSFCDKRNLHQRKTRILLAQNSPMIVYNKFNRSKFDWGKYLFGPDFCGSLAGSEDWRKKVD